MVGVGRSAKNSDSKGTTVKKSNQNLPVDATTPAIPEQVSVRSHSRHAATLRIAGIGRRRPRPEARLEHIGLPKALNMSRLGWRGGSMRAMSQSPRLRPGSASAGPPSTESLPKTKGSE